MVKISERITVVERNNRKNKICHLFCPGRYICVEWNIKRVSVAVIPSRKKLTPSVFIIKPYFSIGKFDAQYIWIRSMENKNKNKTTAKKTVQSQHSSKANFLGIVISNNERECSMKNISEKKVVNFRLRSFQNLPTRYAIERCCISWFGL